MRLARLAAAGLGFGMLAGFCAALLRVRPPALPVEPAAAPATGVPATDATDVPETASTGSGVSADQPDETAEDRSVDVRAFEADSDVPGRVI
jgi:hypothetical protein